MRVFFTKAQFFKLFLCFVKGTVNVISSEFRFLEWYVLFTRVHIKPLPDHLLMRYTCFSN